VIENKKDIFLDTLLTPTVVIMGEKKKIRPTIWISILEIQLKVGIDQYLIATYYPHYRIPIGTSEDALLHGLAMSEFVLQTSKKYFQAVLGFDLEEPAYIPQSPQELPDLFIHLNPDNTACTCYSHGLGKRYQDILVSDDRVFLYPKNFEYRQLGFVFEVAKIFAAECDKNPGGLPAPKKNIIEVLQNRFTVDFAPPKRPRKLPLSTDIH
jgi:hypothetical protein